MSEKKAFNKIKRIVAHNNLLTYPAFNERFDIHTDASGFQLEAVIIQNGKPIIFHSRKLTPDQSNCTVTEE